MDRKAPILVTGASGMLGAAIVRRLKVEGHTCVLTPSRQEADFSNRLSVERYMVKHKPEYIFMCAAKVGGIKANSTYPADFIVQNLTIGMNTITVAHELGIKRLMNIGSGCIYPKFAANPIREGSLGTGELEPSNAPLATAKIAVIEMCKAFNRQHGTKYITAMPTNLYGPGDSYDLQNSHVLPALLRKCHEAKENGTDFKVWGDGSARRDFLHVDDCAVACVTLFHADTNDEVVNIAKDFDISIKELAEEIAKVVGFTGKIVFDKDSPNGTPKKLLDNSIMKELDWHPRIWLHTGLTTTYQEYLKTL